MNGKSGNKRNEMVIICGHWSVFSWGSYQKKWKYRRNEMCTLCEWECVGVKEWKCVWLIVGSRWDESRHCLQIDTANRAMEGCPRCSIFAIIVISLYWWETVDMVWTVVVLGVSWILSLCIPYHNAFNPLTSSQTHIISQAYSNRRSTFTHIYILHRRSHHSTTQEYHT